MCFVISILGLFFAFNFYQSGNFILSIVSLLVSIFFIALMIKNIIYVKKLKEEKKDDN